MVLRLNQQTLPSIEAAAKPQYSRADVTRGIVHLGVGGFHRAHQAVYTDDLLASGDLRWGITGASLRSSSTLDKLKPQDFLYSVRTQSEQETSVRIIGSLQDILVTSQSGQTDVLIQQIAHRQTQVVTLTITEKGYCINHKGGLDLSHPDVVQDLQRPATPITAAAILAQGIALRMTNSGGPLTILSCDNLAGNGRVTGSVVNAMVRRLHPNAAGWVADNVSFPSSMVDRIVPQTSEQDLTAFQTETGYIDNGLVICEPYAQWVIGQEFAGERPAWDMAGAQFVANVQEYEEAKLRLLNATHSALAFLGLLAGYEFIHQTVANPQLRRFAIDLMDNEISLAVRCPSGLDLAQYKASILQRFANSAVPYRTTQVATDGSLKLTQRIFPTLLDRLARGGSINGLCLVVAGWLRCLEGRADDGTPILINDPGAATIAELAKQHAGTNDLVPAIANNTTGFGDLAKSDRFLETLTQVLADIRSQGTLECLRLGATGRS